MKTTIKQNALKTIDNGYSVKIHNTLKTITVSIENIIDGNKSIFLTGIDSECFLIKLANHIEDFPDIGTDTLKNAIAWEIILENE